MKNKNSKYIKNITNNILSTSPQFWQIIHGDLFFGNMLYDVNSETLKILDPRGNFGIDGIYGDIRYDIAKIHRKMSYKIKRIYLKYATII
jgi:Ser/Thr protein kinase RdoA (MazF antagonist)